MTTAIKYPSTSQFRQAISNVKNKLTFDGIDEEGNVKRKQPDNFVLQYVGTVKLHGTNASVVQFEDGTIQFQSKERVITVENDNAGFANFMSRKDVVGLFDKVKRKAEFFDIPVQYPIEIAGEWAGGSIQRGVALNEVQQFFAIFGVAIGRDEHSGMNWTSPLLFSDLKNHDQRIFNIVDFGYWTISIDFDFPEKSQNQLSEITLEIERECPAGKFFGVSGVGEGAVWKPVDRTYTKDSGTWFKVKGEKHSVSKVKTLAAVNPEKLKSIEDFVSYAVTVNRLEQGLQEIGIDIRSVGSYIGWVSRDIFKEEGDVLEANGLEMKDVAKFISNKARGYFLSKVQGA